MADASFVVFLPRRSDEIHIQRMMRTNISPQAARIEVILLSRRRRSGSIQYLLLQVPDILLAGAILWALHRWVWLPGRWAVALFVLWVMKDLAMYLLVRRTFLPPAMGPETLVGTRGVTQEALDPTGYVRIGNELWLAETAHPHEAIAPETPVVVRASRGLTLLVDSASPAGSREGTG
jgi:membrane protein implicated in regulation of membrane protease activity